MEFITQEGISMSVARRRTNHRQFAHAALLASASVMSLGFATEAQAQCVTNNAQPATNVTVDTTIVTCSGTLTAQTVAATANEVEINVSGAGTVLNGGSNIFAIGNLNIVDIRAGTAFDASTVYLQGQSGFVAVAGSATGSGFTVEGDSSHFAVDATGVVAIAPGNLRVVASPTGTNNIILNGTVTGTASNGQYLIQGGDGQQRVFVRNFVTVQSDGLALNTRDGDDEIFIQQNGNFLGGAGNNILVDGGLGNDLLGIFTSGTFDFNTVGIETLSIAAGSAGNVTLNGANADVSQFNLNTGTVSIGNLAALGQANSNVLIDAGSLLNLVQPTNGTFNHVLSGAGTLVLNSGGAAYTFGGTGGTFIGDFIVGSGNTAIIGTSDALGLATFINDGTVQFGGINLANNITGAGQVVVTGNGNSRLSGVNTFLGGLDIQGGILDVASVNSLGSGFVTSSTAGGVLAVGNIVDEVLANDLTGNLALVKAGAGILDLTGTNTYAGGTLINSGAIRVDGFARLGSGPVLSNAGGSLILDYNGAAQLLQTTPFMTGGGTFIKEGTGDVVMNQTSNYTGGTIIREGRIGLNSGDALGTGAIQIDAGAELGIGGITLANAITGIGSIVKTASNQAVLSGDNSGFSGQFDIQNGSVVLQDGRSAGSGAVIVGAGTSLVVDSTVGDTVISANLSGAGDLEKLGNDRLTLAASNSLTGTVFVSGGTLQIEGDQNIGSADIVLAGSGSVLDLSTASLNTLSNNVVGNGRVVKTGTGTVFLTGANTYAGGTDIQQGAIRVTDVSFLGTGPIAVQAGAALDLAIASQQTLAQSVSGAGILRKSDFGDLILVSNALTGGVDIVGGRVIVSTAAALGGGGVSTAADTQLVFDTAGTETISNTISGAGGLTKDGTGVLVIQNANSYTGGTIINAGRLGLNNGQGLGTGDVLILQGAQLSFGGVAVGNNITGAGQVVKTANNTGALTGNNSYSGGTDIQGGSLVVFDPAALGTGTVSTAASTALVVDYSGGTNVALSNALTGAGALIKEGSGTLVVNSANSYTGGTLINAGRLGLNFGNALGTGQVFINAGASLALGDLTYANSTFGAGQIVKTSAGTTLVTGTNTHSGGIDIQAGTLGVTGNAALGSGTVSVASGAVFEYTNAGASTFTNGLAGAGTFRKLGAGLLSFGNNFGIGALNLVAGRTRINTVATTNVTVGSGATLDGTGRIIGNLTNNGTVAPGNSIGTLTVQGNYVQNAGSVLEIEFDSAGNIDLLDVTGNATLNGGTLRFVSIGGAEGQGGTFLRTGGTLTGTFATVETVGAQLPLAVIYQPTAGLMSPSVLTARPSTFNAQSLAAADTTLGFIDSLGVGDVRMGEGNRIWLGGFGAWGNRSAAGTTLAYDHDTRGLSGGINFDVGNAVTLGAAIGWAKGDITLGSNGGGGDQSSVLGSITARYSSNGYVLGGGLLYGKVDQDTVRNVSFSGFSDTVYGSTDSKVFGAFAEVGVPLGSAGGWAFSGNARGSYVRQSQDGYTESGTSPLRLTLGDLSTSTLEGQARLTAKTSLWRRESAEETTRDGLDLRIDLGGRYLGTLGDREIPVTFAASNAGIVLQGDTRDMLQGIAGVALDYTLSSGAILSLGYNGEFGKTDRHAAMASVSFAF